MLSPHPRLKKLKTLIECSLQEEKMSFESAGLEGGQYRPLSSQQIESIHDAALKILEKNRLDL